MHPREKMSTERLALVVPVTSFSNGEASPELLASEATEGLDFILIASGAIQPTVPGPIPTIPFEFAVLD